MSASATITVLDSPQSAVRGLVPDSACDCHVHFFGPAELRAMPEAGTRGTRINLSVTGKADAQQARHRITAVATRNRDLNWHLQLNIGSEIVVELADLLHRLEVPVVLDHFAGLRPGTPGYDEALAVVRSLLRSGRGWVKLSAPYRMSETGTYRDIAETLAARVQANPDRVVWGSDWPHTGGTVRVLIGWRRWTRVTTLPSPVVPLERGSA